MNQSSIKALFVGFVFFTFIIVGGALLLSMIRDKDQGGIFVNDTTKLSSFSTTFDQTAGLNRTTASLRNQITNTSQAPSSEGYINNLFLSVWNTCTFMFDGVNFMATALTGLPTFMNVPELSWATGLMWTLIIIMIIFTIIGSVLWGSST